MLDLTLAPSFKQWFTGFGELSFRWIQICIDLRCVGLVLLFPPSVMLGFWSFQGKVFVLSLPNLIWVFIGLIAFMGLLLVKIAL